MFWAMSFTTLVEKVEFSRSGMSSVLIISYFCGRTRARSRWNAATASQKRPRQGRRGKTGLNKKKIPRYLHNTVDVETHDKFGHVAHQIVQPVVDTRQNVDGLIVIAGNKSCVSANIHRAEKELVHKTIDSFLPDQHNNKYLQKQHSAGINLKMICFILVIWIIYTGYICLFLF